MKRIKSVETFSVLLAVCLTGLDFFIKSGPLSLTDMTLNLFVAQTLIMLKPCPHERPRIPVFEMILYSLLLLACAVFSVTGSGMNIFIVPVAIGILLLTDSVRRFLGKFQRVATLFRCIEVWNNIEDYSKLMLTAISDFLMVVFLAVAYLKIKFLTVFVFILELLFYAYLLFSESPSSLLGKKKSENLKVILEGVGLRQGSKSKDGAAAKMKLLYDKILKYVTENKPYLEEDMKLESLARELGTNKAQLSRTINTMSGRNYSQFYNYFRVEEAVQYMEDHPDAVLNKVAYESGFHNTVSLNSAFTLFKGMTPGEYMERLREQK